MFSEDPLVRSGLVRPADFTLVSINPRARGTESEARAGVYRTMEAGLINADVVWLLNSLPPEVRDALSPGVVINQVRTLPRLCVSTVTSSSDHSVTSLVALPSAVTPGTYAREHCVRGYLPSCAPVAEWQGGGVGVDLWATT